MSGGSEHQRIAWVLGAGFSRSLGGPLLQDLLSYQRQRQSLARRPLPPRKFVYNLYSNFHKSGPRGGIYGTFHWDDAEQFLEAIDTARSNVQSAHAKWLLTLFPGSWDEEEDGKWHNGRDPQELLDLLHRKALQAISAECLFVDADRDALRGERWQPYVAWVEELRAADTIISFNYDLVLELLARHTSGSTLTDESFYLGGVTQSDRVTNVFKLHGSVDWREGARSTINGVARNAIVRGDPEENVRGDGDAAPMIAAPGPQKFELSCGALSPIWAKAMSALMSADIVVFLGYRFPPSDAQAKRALLTHIAGNNRQLLHAHAVLGPDLHHPDNARLAGLLHAMLRSAGRRDIRDSGNRRYAVHQHPLYAEDFLTVFSREWLYGLV